MVGDTGVPAPHGKKKAADDELDPVFFHGKCSDLYEELIWTLGGPVQIKQIIDFCPGEGVPAQVALCKRLSYCAFCFTEHHLSGLQDHLVKLLLKLFVQEGSEFYKPGLAATMKDMDADEEGNDDEPVDDDKPPPAAGKKKGKGKGGKKKGADKGKGRGKGGKKKFLKAVEEAQDDDDGGDPREDPEDDDPDASEEADSHDDVE